MSNIPMPGITPSNTEFVLCSFEGPDLYYSQAGGLGVRVSELSRALAQKGFKTHVIYVGDPGLPGREELAGGNLILNRWCQWISEYYPLGVYQGEEAKLYDFNESVPRFVLDSIVRPAAAQGKVVVVMGEEWHTAEAMIRTSDLLHNHGLRDRVLMLWNANHTMSFHRIDWQRLSYIATLTTVSKYMKHLMWGIGLNPIVIPNGIPSRMFEEVDPEAAQKLRRSFPGMFLFKIGRWDPDKRWNMAVESLACLKRRGVDATLVVRGGKEPYVGEVFYRAGRLGLTIADVQVAEPAFDPVVDAMRRAMPADILNLCFHLPDDLRQLFFHSADAVMANSGMEPFGLVGLEVMASGGVVFTGCTGEDYVIPFRNAIAVETDDPQEIASYLEHLRARPQEAAGLRVAAREGAWSFTWDKVIENLKRRLQYMALSRNVLLDGLPPAETMAEEQESFEEAGTPSKRARAKKIAGVTGE